VNVAIRLEQLPATWPSWYEAAKKAAQVHARRAVASGSVPQADGDDLVQAIVIACVVAASRFDPRRAAITTYMEPVARNAALSFMRSAGRQRLAYGVDPTHVRDAVSTPESLELRVDVGRLLRALNGHDRRLARMLMQDSPAVVGRTLGIARSTVYRHIKQLRTIFAAAGFQPRSLSQRGCR
jgi:RNA polymerase sigma factor (sigma-70 family)